MTRVFFYVVGASVWGGSGRPVHAEWSANVHISPTSYLAFPPLFF